RQWRIATGHDFGEVDGAENDLGHEGKEEVRTLSDPQSVRRFRGTMCRAVILTRVARTAFAKPLQSTYVRSHAKTENASPPVRCHGFAVRIRALRARSGTASAACAGHCRRFDLGGVRSSCRCRLG